MTARTKAPLFGEDLFTAKEVAQGLGVKVETIREWINQGKIRAIKIGKEYRITQGALNDYIAEREREAEELKALNRKRSLDPAPKWELTLCVACGETRAFTTRDQRLEGNVLCANCLTDKDGDSMTAWDWRERNAAAHRRREAIICIEKNAVIVDQATKAGYKRQSWYEVFSCSTCGKPYVVNKSTEDENILEYEDRLTPACTHEWVGAGLYKHLLPKQKKKVVDDDDADLEDLPF